MTVLFVATASVKTEVGVEGVSAHGSTRAESIEALRLAIGRAGALYLSNTLAVNVCRGEDHG